MSVKTDEQPTLFHLHLSDSTPVTEEEITLADGSKAKVLWKDVLVEGEYPMSPSSAGATDTPMRVISEGNSDVKTKTISMSDIIDAHEAGAHKYVTIPLSHKDGVLDNTGYVPSPNGSIKGEGGVRVIEKNGRKVMQAALAFTEPDVKGKVERGTIPDTSGGIFFNFLNKSKKKRFPCSLKHVALTPVPFMGNLDPFPAIMASDDEIPEGTHVEVYEFADEQPAEEPEVELDDPAASDNTVEIVWNEKDGAQWVRDQINEHLSPSQPIDPSVPITPQASYYVTDVSQSKGLALVEEFFKGNRSRFVIPFTIDGEEVSVAPAARWTEVREAMVAASDSDFDELSHTRLVNTLDIALSEMVGKSDSAYRVDEVSLDNRVRIINKGKGRSWIAHFSILDDGSVWIAAADQWEPIEASDKPKDDAKRPASSNSQSLVLSDDETESRLRAARQKRQRLLASQSQ